MVHRGSGILFTFEKEGNSDERLSLEDIVLCDIKPRFMTPSFEAGVVAKVTVNTHTHSKPTWGAFGSAGSFAAVEGGFRRTAVRTVGPGKQVKSCYSSSDVYSRVACLFESVFFFNLCPLIILKGPLTCMFFNLVSCFLRDCSQ